MEPFFFKNMRTEDKLNLHKANKEWTTCIAQNFLERFLKGEAVRIDEVCQNEYEKMKELDGTVYPDPIPFKPEYL